MLTYFSFSIVVKFAEIIAMERGNFSPHVIVAPFIPLNKATTRSLMVLLDFGSSIARGRLLEEHRSAYFAYEACETNLAGYAPVGLSVTLNAVVLPVPEALPYAIGMGQKRSDLIVE